ncbi:hypothetical protein MLD38_011716 [Melastoma candidum]|uniref:Uncharacterized protein n=1 Tax=Melastoma candidum TaxID=119954 RepID=A0ACB9R838_9MYRT|nr:hypothetical protein MLD38_011716 [Melastoma candidum]
MTRILVQRGSSGSSSSNQGRPSPTGGPSSSSRTDVQPTPTSHVPPPGKDEEVGEEVLDQGVEELLEYSRAGNYNAVKNEDNLSENLNGENSLNIEMVESENALSDDPINSEEQLRGLGGLKVLDATDNEGTSSNVIPSSGGIAHPPPPPAPPKHLATHSISRRTSSGNLNSRLGPSRRNIAWASISARTSPTGSRPSSPRSRCENEGYNSADEQGSCFVSYEDLERERQFEIDIRRVKGLEVKRMLEDGNCLFRAIADQVYGDSEAYDLVRQMCMDYLERERDHFSQFITENFSTYCKRKRRDKVYGNNMEIQALSEMYNRPIHIYSYSTEPINIFHGSYNTDTPPLRLSFHHGNHYNSLVDPRRLAIGAGLGFSSLRGTNVDKDQVKAAIKAQQEQQIDNALLAEGRFWSDLELTEKEIEHMVMEASRAEYLASDKRKKQVGGRDSSTSGAEPSSSGGSPSVSEAKTGGDGGRDRILSSGIQILLSMGFSYLQAMKAYSIFGDDVESMVCYLLETSSSRRKGKATE